MDLTALTTTTCRRSYLIVLTLGVIFLVGIGRSQTSEAKPSFRQDLHPFGFLTETHGQIIGNFADINFLSDDLLLVTVNNRIYGGVVHSFTDQPVSKLLLFDVSRRSLLKTSEMLVEKAAGSVRSIRSGQFVLLNELGLHPCSRELDCGLPVITRGPLFVSPEGSRISVGGNSKTEQKLLDSALVELEHFPWMNPNVIPGDGSLLIRRDKKLYVRLPGKPDQLLPFGGGGIWPDARFLGIPSRISSLTRLSLLRELMELFCSVYR